MPNYKFAEDFVARDMNKDQKLNIYLKSMNLRRSP